MTRLVQIFLGFFGLVVVAAILFPVFGRSPGTGHGPSCQTRLKQIGLGFLQYTQDYDEKFPSASGGDGWANVIQPYIKSKYSFQCPTEKMKSDAQPEPKLTGYTDYFFNAQLQQRDQRRIGEQAKIIMVGEGNDGQENTDASYSKTAIPAAWRTDSSSPAFRHLKYASYLFADGHTKASKVGRINTNWSADKYYFQPAK